MKLLNRTLLGFLIYAVAVLLIITPVLYLVINNLIIRQVDETLQVHKREIQSRLEQLPSETAVQQWEDLDGEVVVVPIDRPFPQDSIYTLDASSKKMHRKGDRGRRESFRRERHSHDPENELYRVLVSSVTIKGKPYRLQAQVSLVESEDLIRTLGVTQFFVLLILLAGMLCINWWHSRTMWKPFYNTLGKLKAFRIEKSSPIILEPSRVKEFNDLNLAIDEITRRDHQAFTAQREFTENAAHEMQTPLAIFQSKVELMLQTQPSEQQAALIESLLDATSRLNRLNKALLLLARIDNKQFPETEKIDLTQLTEKLKGTYENDIQAAGLRFVITSTDRHPVAFNPALLEILLTNLISNAIRHSQPGALITVAIGTNSWIIRNSGQPLSIPADRIFDRFRKGNNNQESLGLGLAIARKICEANEATLTYAYQEQEHVFSVAFRESSGAQAPAS